VTPPRRRARPTSETTKLLLVDPTKARAPESGRRGALVVLQGAEGDIGRHRWIDYSVTIGRDPGAELPLDDLRISRQHCRVITDGKGYWVEDLRSTNGTRLNQQPLKRRTELKSGDCIFLGSCVVKFTLSSEAELAYHEQMDTLVGTDDLTGLVAKRRFDAAFVRAFSAARRDKQPIALLMLDIDGLKKINDAHGHPVGAWTIATVGKMIGEVTSPHGAACRLGGDEFVAFLREKDRRVGMEFGESICKWVRGHRFEKDGVVIRPTLSIGVAAYPEDGKSPDALLKRADEALYRAKDAGRDRVSA
jgi:two-component system cell cycle response regulator